MRSELRMFSVMCFVAALAVPAAVFGVDQNEADARYVRVPASAAADLARLNLEPATRIDYGSFVWLELSPTDAAALRGSTVEHREVRDAFTLQLGEQAFDPLTQEPVLPPDLQTSDADEADLHLVQMAGPTKNEWLNAIRADGLEIVQYIHPHTYVVWGDTAARGNAAVRPNVRWTGPFAPAYRLLPILRNQPDQPGEVRVLLYRGADMAAAVRRIEALGGRLLESRKLNHVFELAGFELSLAALADAAKVPGVYSVQTVPTDGGLRGEMSNQVCVNNVDELNQAFPGYQDWLSDSGLNGTGVIIANVDGGIHDSHPELAGRLIGCSGTTCGGGASSGHGTHTAGIMAADGSTGTLDSFGFLRGMGMAPGAELVEQVYSPFYQQTGGMLLLMTDSYNNGASLSGNSWGPSGSPHGYDNDTLQVDIGVRDADPDAPGNQPLTFVLSFMNGYGGTSSQGTPDEAKNIFNIGSTKMQTSSGTQILEIDDLSANSAHGPALDGRTIPHMVAPGCSVDSTYLGSGYGLLCGTSMASPHVSGAVALFIEYYRDLPETIVDPSPALIKAAFLPVARDLAGHQDADGGLLGHPFDSKQGWGRMDVVAVVEPQLAVRYFDESVVLDNTGEEWSTTVSAQDPGAAMRIMLVWTDAPGHGLGGSTPAWNNDLDLIVESDTQTYRGNNFGASGWSVAGGVADDRNNTEGVFIGPTSPGAYTIRVLASDINSDAIPGIGDTTDQDFALVCYNCGPGGPQPPLAYSQSVSTPVNTPVAVTLEAFDDGLPEPAGLTYSVTTLPAEGTLSEPGYGAIDTVPYELAGTQVTYDPAWGYNGHDSFQFQANDGGVPPEGGDSNIATVTVTVGGPVLVYAFPLDTDPGWSADDDWAFGQPTGGGSHSGDPFSGYTGDNVYGYNLEGDYPNNLSPVRYLTTTAIDCSDLTGTRLRFKRWLGVESATWDHANLQVSTDGANWDTVWEHSGGTIDESSWSQQTYNISSYADGEPTVYLRWGMGTTDGIISYPGWNIDDVEIWGLTQMRAAELAAAYSCRSHGDAGEHCIELGIGDTFREAGDNVEPRLGPLSEVRFDATGPVESFSASVACQRDAAYAAAVTTVADGTSAIAVQFEPPLPANDCCTITLTDAVNDSYAVATLEGGVDANLIVNSLDFSAIKARFGQAVNGGNFRYDLNGDGVINSVDSSAVKARFGNYLESCP